MNERQPIPGVPAIVSVTPGGLEAQIPALPEFEPLTVDEAQQLFNDYNGARGRQAAEALDEQTAKIERRLADVLNEFGAFSDLAGRELLEDFQKARSVANPVYSWCPREARLKWAHNQRDNNLVARLYYYLIAFSFPGSLEERLSLLEAAAVANGLCRAAYSALRWRLNQAGNHAVGFALLRLLIDDDERLFQVLNWAGLGPAEAFRREISQSPQRVLTILTRALARKKGWVRGLDDDFDEIAEDALSLSISGELARSRSRKPPALLRNVLGEFPGRVVAGAASRYAHGVREKRREQGRTEAPHAVPDEEDVERDPFPDSSARTEEAGIARADFQTFVAERFRPGDDKLFRLMLEHPDADSERLAGLYGESPRNVDRRKKRIFNAYSAFSLWRRAN